MVGGALLESLQALTPVARPIFWLHGAGVAIHGEGGNRHHGDRFELGIGLVGLVLVFCKIEFLAEVASNNPDAARNGGPMPLTTAPFDLSC